MIQLFIEKQQIDINESFSTLLTMSIDDIKDFGAKNTTFSKTIILPGTKRNNVLFGNIFSINAGNDYNPSSSNISSNFNPAISAQAMIFADNMQVFKGIFRILEVIIEDGFIEYECAVFGELGGFVAALGNKKLEELDMGIADQVWNETNISNSWNSIAGSGVYYPLIDFGVVSKNKVDFDVTTFRPSLYVKQYIDKMITTAGYTYDFPMAYTTMFKSLIIPNNSKRLTTTTSSSLTSTTKAANYYGVSYIEYENLVLGDFTANTGHDTFTYGGTSPLTCDITCVLQGVIHTGSPSFTNIYRVKLYKNGSVIKQQTMSVVTGYFPYTADLSITGVTINPSDIIHVEFTCTNFTYNEVYAYSGLSIISSVATEVPLNYGDTIKMNMTIPKGILQKEFFSSICKMFNLYVFEDYEEEKKLKIYPFIDFYADATSVDWSNKVDRSKPMRIKPMSELNARYYQYKYKQDNDFYAENYRKKYNLGHGDYTYDTQYEFAKETTSIELIFASSVLYQYSGTDKIYPSIYKLSNSNNSEDKMDSVIRIMQAKKITGVTSWAIKNGSTTLASYTAYGYAGHLDDPITPTFDLCFGASSEINFSVGTYTSNSLFNVYWSSYLAEITDKDSRLLTCTMKLNYKDIYKLDFSRLIWIDGALYRINKIIDYNATDEDVCKVELLKVINRIY